MAVMSSPLVMQNNSHPADRHRQWMRYVHGNRGGVIQGSLAVAQNGTPNMSVNVADGMCIVPGTENSFQGHYVVENQGTLNVALSAADPTNPRRDLIIVRVRDAIYSGAGNVATIEPVTGTPAASPADPALPAGSCWVLARVAVAAAATTIVNANLTRFAEGGTGYTGQNGSAAALGGVIVDTSSTRPTAGLYEGMLTFDTDADGVNYYDGSAHQPLGPRGQSLAVASFNPTTSYTLVTGMTMTVPAGRWMFIAKAEAANITGAAGTTDMRIQNTSDATTLDATEIFFGSGVADRVCLSCLATATFTAPKTVQLQAFNAVGGANFPLNSVKFMVHAIIT